jgi:hypothetical protein
MKVRHLARDTYIKKTYTCSQDSEKLEREESYTINAQLKCEEFWQGRLLTPVKKVPGGRGNRNVHDDPLISNHVDVTWTLLLWELKFEF